MLANNRVLEMDKVVLIQCPPKYSEIIPIFCNECLKHDIFDKIYIATNASITTNLDKKCHIIKLKTDEQFSSNILNALPYVEEDILLLCCEDHIMIDKHCKKDFEDAFNFILNDENVGSVRLTYNDKIKFLNKKDNRFITKLHDSYGYLVSLQPCWWRKSCLKSVLKKGEDAWDAETKVSKRARSEKFQKYCVNRTVFFATNFYKNGKYLRHYFVDYAKNNNINIENQMDVFVKTKFDDGRPTIKKIVPYQTML